MDAGSPPIVFTPGSANQAAAAFFSAAIDASARLGRRALLLTRYPRQLPTLPSFAYHEAFVPLSKVLPRCAALVHHGGIGTLAQGLAAGIPQLTMPMGFDQPDNVTRLHRLGVGRWIRPSGFTGRPVAEALHELIEDPRTGVQCRHWSNQMAAREAIERTCDLLEQLA
jgi:UDP:flavonoid glycosyltransferase YjiC (YdhE family)